MFKKIARNPKLLYVLALALIALTVTVVMPAAGLKSSDSSLLVLDVEEMASVLGAGCVGTTHCKDCITTRSRGCNAPYHNCQTGDECHGFNDCSDSWRLRRTCYEPESKCRGRGREGGQSVCIHAFEAYDYYWEECDCVNQPGADICGQWWGFVGVRLVCFYANCETCP